ncbi:uncharacterized protein VP01_493g1 [Puccinia sorghi]|uniref:Uncharacterized protein n=1 Tax=Puccinia sorghi TaxID=27349 RepID=A0A0L6ULZ9_9BASI|nr:uncharacterized protein VP01_493g1 [Puccinia sorghi]
MLSYPRSRDLKPSDLQLNRRQWLALLLFLPHLFQGVLVVSSTHMGKKQAQCGPCSKKLQCRQHPRDEVESQIHMLATHADRINFFMTAKQPLMTNDIHTTTLIILLPSNILSCVSLLIDTMDVASSSILLSFQEKWLWEEILNLAISKLATGVALRQTCSAPSATVLATTSLHAGAPHGPSVKLRMVGTEALSGLVTMLEKTSIPVSSNNSS